MKKKAEIIYFNLLLCLVIIQPVLDLMWFNDGTIPEIAGFSVPTLIRIISIVFLAGLSFIVINFNKKYLFLVFYVLLILLYFIGHHANCMQFTSLVPGNFAYNVTGELFYIIRMCIPISVIYFTYNSRINKKYFDKCVIFVVLIMSISVIGTNIFEVAYGSYTSELIDGNIFDWFLRPEEFTSNQLASKGWFYSSITSTVLVLIYPYVLYLFFELKTIKYFIIAFIHGIALFMFGTKATAFSVIIVSVIMTTIYLFVGLVKKDFKISQMVCLGMAGMLLINFVLLNVSPSTMKMEFDEVYSTELDESSADNNTLVINSEEEIITFFDENYKNISIKEQFLKESYPYIYDPVFWYEFYTENVPSVTMQNRIVQEEMLKRVKEVNDNEMDDLFGIGYTRTSDIYNLEKDFLYQYYSMGSLGVTLLLGPYVLCLLLMMFTMLKKFKEKVTLFNCAIVLGAGLTLCLAYYSGNTMENLGITIWIGFMVGFLLKSNFGIKVVEAMDEKQ